MKLAFVALLAVLCLAREPVVKTVEQVREHIETFDGTTLVMFFDPDARVDRKYDMIKKVNDIILSDAKWKDIPFIQEGIVVDQIKAQTDRTQDPAALVDELKLDLIPLRHSPTIAAFRNGWATWVHGENAVNVIKAKLEDFDVKAKEKQNEKK